jgi:formylglycine-generating enzyme
MMRRARGKILRLAAVSATALAVAGWWWPGREPAPPSVCLRADDRPTFPGDGMVWIEPGRFKMGSEAFRIEEAPVREVAVDGFWIDNHDVTNAQFDRFVRETGYVTRAERRNGALPPGAFVFVAPGEVHDLHEIEQWWKFVPGADWRHPEGPRSTIGDRMNHPVVQVAYEDAEAYARWAGRALPSEAQWEYVARGGLDGKTFVWGDEADHDGEPQANFWHGVFPVLNLGANGYKGTSPVGCFKPNGYGLYDMAGNVWQWTRDPWSGSGSEADVPYAPTARSFRVIKGGSFLCAANFCARYRPAARQPGDSGVGTSHIGFRTVLAAGSRASN